MATVEVLFSSKTIASSARGDYWREVTRPVFDIGLPDENHRRIVEGDLSSRSNGELLIGRSSFSAQSFVRSREKIKLSGLDGYVLQLFVAGSMRGNVGEDCVHVRPGDLYILDLGKVCENHVSSGSRLTMMVERGRFERLVGRADLHGMIFRRDQPINQLLTDFLVELWSVSLNLSYADSVLAVGVVGNLIKGGLGACTPKLSDERALFQETLRSNILHFIEANLAYPELGVETIIRRFGVSRAGLYRAFELDGGIAMVIRKKRLHAARDLLAQADRLPISQVAYTCGFTNQSQFFKVFRRQFGFSPSESFEVDPTDSVAPNIGGLVTHFTAAARLY